MCFKKSCNYPRPIFFNKSIRDNLSPVLLDNTQVGVVANMSALLMKQMLEDAEQQGAGLAFDTSSVEDQCEQYGPHTPESCQRVVRTSLLDSISDLLETVDGVCVPFDGAPDMCKLQGLFVESHELRQECWSR